MLFQRMPGAIRAVFDAEMDVVARTDDVELAWRSLENAHILPSPGRGRTPGPTSPC